MKNKKVKEPKKARKAIEELHNLVDLLGFFYQERKEFKKDVLEKAIYVEDTLRQYGIDKKVDHARFASKFRHLFGKENKELKEELRELREEVRVKEMKIEELCKEGL